MGMSCCTPEILQKYGPPRPIRPGVPTPASPHHAGEGIKTIVPAKASVKLAARLVPDQSPDAVLDAVTRHVQKFSSPLANVTVKRLGEDAGC